jgi:hypothetical protein
MRRLDGCARRGAVSTLAAPMPNALRTQLDTLAATLTDAILTAVQSSGSLADILLDTPDAPKRGPGRPRKTAPAISNHVPPPKAVAGTTGGQTAVDGASTIDLIIKYLRSHPGSSGEATRKTLGITKPRWSKAAARAVASGKLRKEGERRSTKYWAV